MKLSPSFLETSLSAGRYSDGRNLYLSVSPTGSKSWVFMWAQQGRQRELGLGSYTGAGRAVSVSLKQARLAADAVRVQLAAGIDPIAAKRSVVLSATTFGDVMEMEIAKQRVDWKVKDGVCEQEIEWRRSLTTHASGLIRLAVGRVDVNAVLKVLKPIWADIPVTAERVRYRIEKIMDTATAKGMFTGENPARYKGHIEVHLGKRPSKKSKGENRKGSHAALHYDAIPGFMAKLLPLKGNASKALAFTTLTAVRTDEARLAQWSEFNLDAGLWVIPAERMKAGVAHVVPLSTTALELLASMPRVAGNPFVFFGKKDGETIGATAMADKLTDPAKKGGMGYAGTATVHGMRSSFRDWVGDKTHFASDDAELCLAHGLDATEGAYRRETAVEKRRAIMQAWADYCEGKSNVVALAVAA